MISEVLIGRIVTKCIALVAVAERRRLMMGKEEKREKMKKREEMEKMEKMGKDSGGGLAGFPGNREYESATAIPTSYLGGTYLSFVTASSFVIASYPARPPDLPPPHSSFRQCLPVSQMLYRSR